jgi:T5SS/PEP-CTERM-associated repeat protein
MSRLAVRNTSRALRIYVVVATAVLCFQSVAVQQAAATVTTIGNVTPVPNMAGGNVAAPFLIGDSMQGTVTINGGSIVTVTNGGTSVGDEATGTGELTVTGSLSALNALASGADLVVGNSGFGQATVSNMGQITIQDDLIVGLADASSGFFTVADFGTLFDTNDAVIVGQSGEGIMEVFAGARVFADDTVVGQNVTGEGRITIAGNQTQWRQLNSITVGDAGLGTLQVLSGARLETLNLVIGNTAASAGVVEIDGAGSVWDVTGFMNLGISGLSTFEVTGGARVTNTTTARLSTLASGESHAVVSGQHSRWTIGLTLTVGDFGYGTLDILDGGRVIAGDNVIIGDNTNSRGEVVVDGVDSTWEIDGTLDVSHPGEAKLTISNGGFVTATNVLRVGTAGELVMDGGRIQSPTGSGLTNNGLVRGGGNIAANVNNTATGEFRIEPGDYMVTHNIFSNAGLVDVQYGELEVFGATTNSGDIDLRGGILRMQNGLSNNAGSQLAIVGGEVDVFGNFINNAGATLVVGGESHAAFHDLFTNNGSLLVTPGSELLTLENLDLNGSGSLTVQLAGSDADGFGRVQTANAANISGTLQVELSGSFAPQAGDSFEIVTAGAARNGVFTTEVLPPLGGGLGWDVIYNPQSVVLSVVGSGLPGDYTNDGIVDAADYVMWRKLNGGSTPLPNDSTPGSVDDQDHDQWRESFGHTAGAGVS